MGTKIIENGRCTADCNENSDEDSFSVTARTWKGARDTDEEGDDAVTVQRSVECDGCGAETLIEHSEAGTLIVGPIEPPWEQDEGDN
jgi:hypothetical protein